jgi:pantoate--beta-alanine ligase
VKPDIAYFGQKDAQQAIIIRRLVADLNLNLKIRVLPTVREPDGLAMSSRNTYLNTEQRHQATVLYRSLQKARQMIKSGERSPQKIISAMRKLIERGKFIRIDYIRIVNAENLSELKVIKARVLIALAVFIGRTRLIDNTVVNVKRG